MSIDRQPGVSRSFASHPINKGKEGGGELTSGGNNRREELNRVSPMTT